MIINWFKKKKAAPEQKKPSKIAVHCPDGVTVVHYAAYRTLRSNGVLSLHNERNGKGVVAEYAPGAWSSITTGTRRVSA